MHRCFTTVSLHQSLEQAGIFTCRSEIFPVLITCVFRDRVGFETFAAKTKWRIDRQVGVAAVEVVLRAASTRTRAAWTYPIDWNVCLSLRHLI
jgi:hypothetical protein